MVTAIRALLRFAHVSGRTPALLAGGVPAVAGWRLASLPRCLAAGQAGRLLDGCDRDTVTGRRDYAKVVAARFIHDDRLIDTLMSQAFSAREIWSRTTEPPGRPLRVP
jgi:hypothetical protein